MPEPDRARRLRVTLTQWHATRDVAANLKKALELIRAAAPDKPDLVLLPENGLMIGTNDEMRAAALAIDSPEIDALRQGARDIDAAVILGGFKHRNRDGSVHNTALIIAPDGEIAGSYDKIHLFDATIGGQKFQASRVEVAGTQPLIAVINDVKIGVTICYDVRFPELYRTLALAGAEVFLVPAAFTFKTGDLQHWEVLLRARAIENTSYVLASATIRGRNGAQDAFETWGHAMAIDPWGRVLANLGTAEFAATTVELDPALLENARSSLPVLRGVRPQAYATAPH
ncbi:MAG TPA: nitrilase-related carbon-nitrogen hydrolase, partial [Candidatus Binataceae bacterium]|nr:nitrilase-related carbon-nitrogen hydrolase [Candidatus Binataceae bacterium]